MIWVGVQADLLPGDKEPPLNLQRSGERSGVGRLAVQLFPPGREFPFLSRMGPLPRQELMVPGTELVIVLLAR